MLCFSPNKEKQKNYRPMKGKRNKENETISFQALAGLLSLVDGLICVVQDVEGNQTSS